MGTAFGKISYEITIHGNTFIAFIIFFYMICWLFSPTDEALSGLSVGMIGFMQIRAILNAEAFTASIVHEKIEEAFLAVIALNDCCKKYDDKLLVK